MNRRRKRLTGAPLRASVKREDVHPEIATPEAQPAPVQIVFSLRGSAKNHAEEALEALATLVKEASSEHVRVAAANAILDRAFGKPLTGARAVEEATDEEDEDGDFEVVWLGRGS